MLHFDIGILGPDLLDDLAPETARREDIGLVHAGQLAAPATRELERKPTDTCDLLLRVGQRVDRRSPVWCRALLRRAPEVQTAGELAHDQQVDALDELRPKRRR